MKFGTKDPNRYKKPEMKIFHNGYNLNIALLHTHRHRIHICYEIIMKCGVSFLGFEIQFTLFSVYWRLLSIQIL